MQVLMVMYDGKKGGRRWWRKSLSRKNATKLMLKLELAGKNPVLVSASIRAECVLDCSSRLLILN